MNEFGLSNTVMTKLETVFRRHPEVESVQIYGSRAMGSYREGSDIDLVLKGDISIHQLSDIIDEIDELLLPYMFDISVYDHIENTGLLEHIHRVGKQFLPTEHTSSISANH
ncbi:DNA polymerase beta domain-containing protein [Salinispira pacifica]|uniref:DNA polymerase beta domain-containing protein n=2 Tax=Salinispira pacifica TaxID=1307761 RepID=V5WLN8_9SPIO|nr:DNA polymerase beta domain-containing protein [Salinispira pacifica]